MSTSRLTAPIFGVILPVISVVWILALACTDGTSPQDVHPPHPSPQDVLAGKKPPLALPPPRRSPPPPVRPPPPPPPPKAQAWRMVNQAIRLQGQGDHEAAEPLLQKALGILRPSQGEVDLHAPGTLAHLAISQAALGQPARAEASLREALAITRARWGDEHPTTLEFVEELGIHCWDHGERDEGLRLFRQALTAKEGILRDTHPSLLDTKQILLDSLRQRGETEEANGLWGEVVDAVRRGVRLGDGRRSRNQHEYGIYLAGEEQYEQAETHLREAFEGRDKALGRGHPLTRESLQALIGLYRKTGEMEKVEEYEALRAKKDEGAPAPSRNPPKPVAKGTRPSRKPTQSPHRTKAPAPRSEDGVPELIAALDDKDPKGRKAAAKALGRIGAPAAAAAPALIWAIQDEDHDVRIEALRALGRLGPAAQEAVPAMGTALWGGCNHTRREAAFNLSDMGPSGVPLLVRAMWDRHTWGPRGLLESGDDARYALNDLIEMLGDEDPQLRGDASWILDRLGPLAEEAIPTLLDAMSDEEDRVSRFAVSTLLQMRPAALPLSFLVGRLELHASACTKAAQMLAELGADAKDALPALRDARDKWAKLVAQEERERKYTEWPGYGTLGTLERAVDRIEEALREQETEEPGAPGE